MEDYQTVVVDSEALGQKRCSMSVLCDGHGGQRIAEFAVKVLPHLIASQVAFDGAEITEKMIKDAFYRVDELLLDVNAQSELLKEMTVSAEEAPAFNLINYKPEDGATCILSVITPDKLISAGLGDSRIILCSNGKAVQLTVDHEVKSPVEIQRISKAGCVISSGRVDGCLNLTRAFGDFDIKHKNYEAYGTPISREPHEHPVIAEPDVDIRDLNDEEDEFLVLCCDGVHNMFDNQTLVDMIREDIQSGHDLYTIAQSIVDKSIIKPEVDSKAGKDNVSLQIVLLPTAARQRLIPELIPIPL
jgi:serine/threonine protein phosphatase PrpC